MTTEGQLDDCHLLFFFFFFFKSALSDVTNGTDVSPRLILAPPSEANFLLFQCESGGGGGVINNW